MAETFKTQAYNKYPFLLFPGGHPYYYSLSGSLPLSVFVYQNTNLFGDPTPMDLTDISLKIRIYDKQGQLIHIGKAIVKDYVTAEIQYAWNQLDIINPGIYYCEFIFQGIDNSIFVLPDKGSRLEIVAT